MAVKIGGPRTSKYTVTASARENHGVIGETSLLKLLRQLFAGRPELRTMTGRLDGPGTFNIEVASESDEAHNLDLIWDATSNQYEHRQSEGDDFWEHAADARLTSESDDPHNPYAIRIEIAGRVVGHLHRGDALRIHRRLTELGFDLIDVSCKGMITGRHGFWQVTLDFATVLQLHE